MSPSPSPPDERPTAPGRGEVRAAARLPDFIIIGTMKSGTTSLYRWLDEQPECSLSANKEPDFFSREEVWRKGLAWYGSLFGEAGSGQLAGEASVSYTSPTLAPIAAQRMVTVLPQVRLICLLRDPVERLRSHYRHQVQRSRESRSLLDALEVPDNPYLSHSLYHACLQPYLEIFPLEQVCIVRFEDLVGDHQEGWAEVLQHLGLPYREPPRGAYNVTAEKAQFSPLMLRMWEGGLLVATSRVPGPVRALGKRLLTRTGPAYRSLLESSDAPIPVEITGRLWEDVARLEARLGLQQPLWPR